MGRVKSTGPAAHQYARDHPADFDFILSCVQLICNDVHLSH